MHRTANRLLLGLAAATLLSTQLRAQGVAEDAFTFTGAEVPVLTPNRIPQALRDIPATVTILPADLLSAYGILGLTEAVRLVAGAVPKRLSGAAVDLRMGEKQATGRSRVTLLVDGIEIGDAGTDDDDAGSLPVSIEDIQRIEVTSGPGASGFGYASKVVVINFVTKHPEDVERGLARLVTGSNDTLNGFARGGWSLGPAAFRLSLHHRERGEIDDGRSTKIDRVTLRSVASFGPRSSLAIDAAYLKGGHDANLDADLGRTEQTNGYASMVWTQGIGPSNELSLRADRSANSSKDFLTECVQGAACEAEAGNERRTRIELQDVHVVSDSLRLAIGLGVRHSFSRFRNDETARWSVRFRHANAGLQWLPASSLSLSADWSADEADAANHDRTQRLGANWHLSEDQTLRLVWSASDWASDQNLRILMDEKLLLIDEQMQSSELGYLLEDPARSTSINARLFWSRLEGQIWRRGNGKKEPSQQEPAHGEFYGAEVRAAGELSDGCTGFISLSTLTEGSHSGTVPGHRPRPWGGAAGISMQLWEGWRVSGAYYAFSKAETSTQVSGRADLTVLKDFRWGDVRWLLGLNLRRLDHVIRTDANGKNGIATGVEWLHYLSLKAAL